jgi:hypothetical protein
MMERKLVAYNPGQIGLKSMLITLGEGDMLAVVYINK